MANRFWKSQPVSGAIVSVASPPQVRLTVSSTTGIATGDICQVFGIVGTTEANGTWTVTVNATISVQSITCGAFTGTLDFSANNNNVTLSAAAAFNGSGTGTRTINLGNGTWTISTASAAVTPWTIATTTGLTFNANSSTIDLSGVVAAGSGQTFFTGGLTYNVVKISGSRFNSGLIISGGGTIGTLNIA